MRRVAPMCAAVLAALMLTVHAAPGPPKLAVIIVVDQMRADYVPRFSGDWSSGLKRLVDRGAVFTRTAYPYLTTVTCAGHATIGTGAFPHRHGMFQNTWWDRNRAEIINCATDRSVRPVVYGGEDAERDGPANLMLPTFAELMRTERRARVVSMSIKARSAIMLAGHGGDAVTWLNESLDHWQTSSAFGDRPVPQVQTFVQANPIEADYGRTWNRLLPPDKYQGVDNGDGEAPPKGWTRTFPHVLSGDANDRKPDEEFYTQWERSPFADAYLGRMAAALVESMQLGQRGVTDVLAVSFSSPDVVGHAFGPRSQEVEDMFAHLDRTVGALLDRLDALVGAGEYTLALTSDHGVTELPEQLRTAGKDAGRLSTRPLSTAINDRIKVVFGDGTYVSRVNGNDVYLMPGVYGRLTSTRGAMNGLIETLASQPGVARVFTADQLMKGTESTDPLLRAASLSYVPGRSGDLVLAPKPGWVFIASGTTHGSATPDDQNVPLIFYGKGIKPGRYDTPSTPADATPTLAAICDIAMPQAEGKALRDAIASE